MDLSHPAAALARRTFGSLQAEPDSDTLSPLPGHLRNGLITISVFACISFALATSLWLYLNIKFISWRLNVRSRANRVARNIPDPPVVPNLDFEDHAFRPQGQSAKNVHESNLRQIQEVKKEAPNQFLVLIYNLFLADMHQSAAFMLSATWLRENGIFVGSPTCFIQGYFDSNGDLASSCFIALIAAHTWLSVVRGYQPRQNVLYIVVGLIWLFVYSMSSIPLIVTRGGASVGGYFVRAGPWCWITRSYEELRLATHYIFIFAALFTTSCFYVAIFLHLRRQSRLKGGVLPNMGSNSAFLVYAIVYVTCTLPLAIGRIATMADVNVPMGYYCFAGTMIAANGLFDCLIFGWTRYSIVFGSTGAVDERSTGLETFSFMRTPARDFGHEVWIHGGSGPPRLDKATGVGGWLSGKGAVVRQERVRNTSQESLRADDRMEIQMDVVTSMTVEERRKSMRYVEQGSPSDSTSLKSLDSPRPMDKSPQ